MRMTLMIIATTITKYKKTEVGMMHTCIGKALTVNRDFW